MALSFAKLFGSKPNRVERKGVIGVDVGASSIKIVQLHMQNKVPTLDTYGELQLGPYEGVEIGRIARLRVDKLIEAFVDILREASASADSIALALSYSASFVAVVNLKETDPEKITAMMPVEARKYVPISLTEVMLDWFPIASREGGRIMQLLLVAIHKEAVRRYEAMVKGVALNTVCTEVEMFSSIRSALTQEDETVALIDCGASATKVYIAYKGIIQKTHSVPLSGVSLTEALATELGISFQSAEEMKRTVGLLGIPEDLRVQKALVQPIERGFREIHKVIKVYESEHTQTVNKVVLTGGGALMVGLGTYVHDLFSIPVDFADPFAKVAHPVFLEDTLKSAGPSFSTALGAALRGLLQ